MIAKLRGLICRILRSHKWRRLRKGELHLLSGMDKGNYRICDRCHVLRAVKTRERKAA